MSDYYTPTIKEIIDREKLICFPAESYLAELHQIPHEIKRLRIRLAEVANHPDQYILVCALCRKPVRLRGGEGSDKKRIHLRHAFHNANCPYQSGKKEDLLIINARKYHGLREGAKHKWMKNALEECLNLEKKRYGKLDNIQVEQIIFDSEDFWRKPDINFTFGEYRLAMEIQLSTTYLDVINSRHKFYAGEGIFMLWIFDEMSTTECERSFAQDDVIFNNAGNAYVFDEEARVKSVQEEKLHLKCFYVQYDYNDEEEKIDFKWYEQWITLSDLTYDANRQRLYFFDSEKSKEQAVNKKENSDAGKAERQAQEQAKQHRVQQMQTEQRRMQKLDEILEGRFDKIKSDYLDIERKMRWRWKDYRGLRNELIKAQNFGTAAQRMHEALKALHAHPSQKPSRVYVLSKDWHKAHQEKDRIEKRIGYYSSLPPFDYVGEKYIDVSEMKPELLRKHWRVLLSKHAVTSKPMPYTEQMQGILNSDLVGKSGEIKFFMPRDYALDLLQEYQRKHEKIFQALDQQHNAAIDAYFNQELDSKADALAAARRTYHAFWERRIAKREELVHQDKKIRELRQQIFNIQQQLNRANEGQP